MSKARILVIDDEESPRESLRFILKDRYDVTLVESGASGLEAASRAEPFDIVLLDMKMPGMDGLEVLSKILQLNPRMPVVMVTAITEAKPAVQAMKMGAADYLNKPFDVDEIRLVVDRILKEKALEREVGRLRTELQAVSKFENIVGSSAAMQKVYALVQRVVDTETTVLVLGETGTGKELVARALHYNSVRREGPFIPVHCAAIPSELLESELFGHEKGSFTGALQRRIGMFEAAGGGTLFLDEIGEMPLGTQSKLLRAIQEREIRRVGGQETISINVRLVCATNRDLEKEIARGAFREDLYYRINVRPQRRHPPTGAAFRAALWQGIEPRGSAIRTLGDRLVVVVLVAGQRPRTGARHRTAIGHVRFQQNQRGGPAVCDFAGRTGDRANHVAIDGDHPAR